METLNYNENCWKKECPKVDCRKNKCHCGLKHIVIPADLGDDSKDSPVAPKNGNYCNSIVIYESNKHVYIYSEEGVYTLIDVDAINVAELEEEIKEALAKVEEIEGSMLNCFDTVADMKASVALEEGSYAKTLGFYSANDGGGAIYKITGTGAANEMDVIAVGDLFAILVVSNEINVKQLGAHGNNSDDDTDILNYALSKFNWRVVYIPTGSYKINGTINITETKTVYGDGMFNSSLVYYGVGNAVQILNNYYGILTIKELSILKNGGYDASDVTSIGVEIIKSSGGRTVGNLYMDKVVIRYFHTNFNCSTDGARMSNSHFTNCNFEGGYDNFFIYGGFNNSFDSCRFGEGRRYGYYQQAGEGKFVACSFEGNSKGVVLANSGGSYSFMNCFFENVDTTEESNIILLTISRGNLALIENISVINCHFYGAYHQVFLTGVKRVTFMNNTMFNPGNYCVGYGWTNTDFESITFINNNFAVDPHSGPAFVHFYG